MKFHRITGPKLWGDYGAILASGMVRKGRTDNAPVHLYRTGPFIPPISFPFRHLIITDDFRQKMESAGLFAFRVNKVKKKRIVKLNWQNWDLKNDQPRSYPRGGEPENYIFGGWHSWSASRQMGEVWDLRLEEGAETHAERNRKERRYTTMVNPETWDGQHFFKSKTQGFLFVTDIAARWFLDQCPEWITLEQCVPWNPACDR